MTVVPAAAVHRAAPVRNLSVVMHDPGCHWFQTSGGYVRTMSVAGPVMLKNLDEAALNIVGPSGKKVEKVLSKVRLGRGTYHITMVGQAPDDNHLKLTVS